MSLLTLELLGPLQITQGAKSPALESIKVRALLVFLALEQNKAHSRDHLVGLLWSEYSEENARVNLRRALWNLQHALTPEASTPFFLAARTTIQFNPDADAYVDALQFRALLATCQTHPHRAIETCRPCIQRLERAIALYRGEFLQNLVLPHVPPFEEWVLVQREHLHRQVITALTQVTAHYEQAGAASYAETVSFARRHIELEAWSEEPYRVLMRIYAAQNQREQAIAMYHILANVLQRELNLEPSAETTALYKHLRNQSSVSSLQSPISKFESPISNLPLPPTPLVGRETELAQLAEKITRADCRLLTLVGEGGIGKTRLALETARANRAAFPRGVYFVDLQPLVSRDLLPHAIAEALLLQLRGSASTAQQVSKFLQDLAQPLLLILDNFEQLLAGPNSDVGFLGDLQKRAPQVTLLVTSRERLNLAGEWLFEVDGLRAPTTLPTRIEPEWGAAEAVQLFAQCAARQHIDMDVWSDAQKRAVMRITQLVEGMPLAIELAAAWLRTLAPVEIANEIARSLDILASMQRNVPARHASVRAVFEHSWRLLTPTEQAAFARLSVFRRGFTRQAAHEIANASLQILSALVDKSLVKRAAAGHFRLHELLRQFTAEKLEQSPIEGSANGSAQGETQKKHLTYYFNLLVAKANTFNSDEARASLAELRLELDNLRAAWQWAVAQHEITSLARALPALSQFCYVAGLVMEGETLLRDTIATPNADSMLFASELYARLANFDLHRGDYPQTIDDARKGWDLARAGDNLEMQVMAEWLLGTAIERSSHDPAGDAHIQHALAAAEQAGLVSLQAQILYSMSENLMMNSVYPGARAYLARALELLDETGEKRLVSDILTLLARVAYHQKEPAECEALLERALRLKRKLGDPIGEIRIFLNSGNLAVMQFRLDRALDWYARAATLALEIGDNTAHLHARINYAGVLQAVGKYADARAEYLDTLKRAEHLGERWVIYHTLHWLALLEITVGDFARALAYAQEYLTRAEQGRDELELAKARERMASAHLFWGNIADAEGLYQQALEVYVQKQNRDYVLRCQAGLARILFARGELTQARALALQIRDGLMRQFPAVDVDPFWIFLTCYEVLRACNDPSAPEVLRHAHAALQERAGQIQDTNIRTSYLEAKPWFREIQRAYMDL